MKKDGQRITQFDVLAMKAMKDKNTGKKEGSLGDLFKCVDSLNSSTVSLNDYVNSIGEPGYREKIANYLEALKRIQVGLLEIAQDKITGIPGVSEQLEAMEETVAKVE